MRTRDQDFERRPFDSDPIEFPRQPQRPFSPADAGDSAFGLAFLPESAGQVYDAVETMSRRIDDLARELGCLGYFDDDGDDSPRAA